MPANGQVSAARLPCLAEYYEDHRGKGYDMSIADRTKETGRSQLFSLLRQATCLETAKTTLSDSDCRQVNSAEFAELRRVASVSLQVDQATHLR